MACVNHPADAEFLQKFVCYILTIDSFAVSCCSVPLSALTVL